MDSHHGGAGAGAAAAAAVTQGLASNLHEQVATVASAEEVASWQEVP
jgi:hypothetical protein